MRVFASACLRPAATKPSEQNDKLVKEETIFAPPVISIIKKGTSTSLTWQTARDSVSLFFFFLFDVAAWWNCESRTPSSKCQV